MSETRLVTVSYVAILVGGYGTEAWDTFWTARDFQVSIWEAVDVGDYTALTLGSVLTIGAYALCCRAVKREVVS